ncbi:MAG TPA: YfiR family protein, partial [Steroidobacteraceae bacterium]|nr:YfiR family protein [Steroidobacteraceae bacterium]
RIVYVLVALCATAVPAMAADQYREDAIKAAFLYRFTGYIEWPSNASAPGQFTIAVIGSTAVADELTKVLPGHDVKGMPARVKEIRSIKELGSAQMLYIGPEYGGNVRALINAVPEHVLVVTDSGEGLDDGSVVNFMLVDRRVRFEISLNAAERAGLKVSSELLSVAARVRGVPQRSDTSCEPRPFDDELSPLCIPRLASLGI